MDESYKEAIKIHTQNCILELEKLSKEENWDNRDFLSSERLLQLLIGSAIGLAKNTLVSKGQSLAASSGEAFNQLAKMGIISVEELAEWRKIIGMRNTLVHDYLQIDAHLIKSVVKTQKYLFIKQFVDKIMQKMA